MRSLDWALLHVVMVWECFEDIAESSVVTSLIAIDRMGFLLSSKLTVSLKLV